MANTFYTLFTVRCFFVVFSYIAIVREQCIAGLTNIVALRICNEGPLKRKTEPPPNPFCSRGCENSYISFGNIAKNRFFFLNGTKSILLLADRVRSSLRREGQSIFFSPSFWSSPPNWYRSKIPDGRKSSYALELLELFMGQDIGERNGRTGNLYSRHSGSATSIGRLLGFTHCQSYRYISNVFQFRKYLYKYIYNIRSITTSALKSFFFFVYVCKHYLQCLYLELLLTCKINTYMSLIDTSKPYRKWQWGRQFSKLTR